MRNRTSVPSRNTATLSIVDGDLIVERYAVVKGTGTPPTVKVTGSVHCEGHDTFECNLSAENIESEDDIVIQGDLDVKGEVVAEDGRLEVHGNLRATRVDVDDALYVGKDLTVNEVDVGGLLDINGNIGAHEIDVGGSLRVRGKAKADEVDVGGSLAIEIQGPKRRAFWKTDWVVCPAVAPTRGA